MARSRALPIVAKRSESAEEICSRQPAWALSLAAASSSAVKRKAALADTCFVMTVLRRRPALQIRGRRHADHIEAGVDEVHFAGDAARKLAQQIKGRAADM